MPRKPKSQKAIEEVTYLLNMVAEDSSVPRNIRRAANNALKVMQGQSDSPAIRAANAIGLLDEVSQDPNCPLHARTRIYQILSSLETIRD